MANLSTAILEKQLGYEPLRLGESRESSVHLWVFLPPVGIDFEVIEDDKRVIVQLFSQPSEILPTPTQLICG